MAALKVDTERDRIHAEQTLGEVKRKLEEALHLADRMKDKDGK